MNPDNNNKASKTDDDSMDDAQDHSYSSSTILPDVSLSSSTPSTITHNMQNEHQMSFVSTDLTFSIVHDNDEDDNRNEEQQTTTTTTTSILSQEWLPPAASTPVAATTVARSTRRSERELENELFRNIENLVREFLARPNREYPYYRVIRWTIGEEPRLEYVLTVVINRPTIILE